MIFNDKNQRCTLIAPSAEPVVDEAGFEVETDEPAGQRTVWCKVTSVTAYEIATMGQNNIKPSLKVTLWANEYGGETEVEIEGLTYGVYRTYQPGQDEIELYLERKGGVN